MKHIRNSNVRDWLLALLLSMFCSVVVAKTPPALQKHCGRRAPALNFSHPVRSPLDEIYFSTDVPRHIPDGPGGVATSTLTIPDNTTIADLNVMVTLTHTWVRDLRISLIGPNLVEVVLLDQLEQDDAENMTDTWFDDQAGLPMDEGAPPFTGSFIPQDSLSVFDGLSAQGTWTLRVEDQLRADSGDVIAWAVEINAHVYMSGQVLDSLSGQGLPDVQVMLVSADTAAADTAITFSNPSGIYEFYHLQPGLYNAQFTKAYYDTVTAPGIQITDSTLAQQNVTMHSVGVFVFYSTAPPQAIPDTSTATMTLDVSAELTIADLDVVVNITHPWVGDLLVYLISPPPDLDTVELFEVSPNDPGDNLTDTRFDDEAATPIADGTAPFTGSFRPIQQLNRYDGISTIGQWTLYVEDTGPGDTGTIDNYALYVTTATSAHDPFIPHPSSLSLSSFPNPFNSTTQFRFDLTQSGLVELALFDLLGRHVATLIDEPLQAGAHQMTFDAVNLPSGLYIARLSTPTHSESRKIILLK